MNAILSSMAWATSITSRTVKAQGKDEYNIYRGPNVNKEMLAYIIVGQAVVIILLYVLVNFAKLLHTKWSMSRHIAPSRHKASDNHTMCDVYVQFGNGFKICKLYVCSVTCHAANTSLTKTSQKIRVVKYFNNAIYDVIRME